MPSEKTTICKRCRKAIALGMDAGTINGQIHCGPCWAEASDEARRQTSDPLATYRERQRLDRHVEQAIRERADIAYVMDGDTPRLRPEAELSIWRAVEQAINEMGWRIARAEH